MTNGRRDAMTTGQSSASGFQLNSTHVIVGAALLGTGAMIGLSGLIIGGTAVFSAARQWYQAREIPPTEVVKHKLDQTRAATMAGASAWQHHNGAQRARA
jgi:hypothetical protein